MDAVLRQMRETRSVIDIGNEIQVEHARARGWGYGDGRSGIVCTCGAEFSTVPNEIGDSMLATMMVESWYREHVSTMWLHALDVAGFTVARLARFGVFDHHVNRFTRDGLFTNSSEETALFCFATDGPSTPTETE